MGATIVAMNVFHFSLRDNEILKHRASIFSLFIYFDAQDSV